MISKKQTKPIYDRIKSEFKTKPYMKKLGSMKKDFKLTDVQYDMVHRYLTWLFSRPIIDQYITRSSKESINYRNNSVVNKKTAEKIYRCAKSFIFENRILLNNEIIG